MNLFLILAAAIMIGIHCVNAQDCISPAMKEELTNDVLRNARATRLSESSVRCLEDFAQSFKPMETTVNDGSQSCYDRKEFGMHMSRAIKPCIHELGESHKFGEVSEIAIKQAEEAMQLDGSESMGLVRTRKKKNRKRKYTCKRKKFIKKKGSCTCFSGCHYCCVLTSLRAGQRCFNLYCGGRGCCA